ncbi:unnamed protein product [Phytophthora fragariaefolia]|uniref:Unnamed protein product n=1 Tax=Phytophthora fragariaefolia TaxID=1490495 RepID=A0A9W6Y1V4_9STRA|nr:unnamed protein product [Phytophthora fragariaefolia]
MCVNPAAILFLLRAPADCGVVVVAVAVVQHLVSSTPSLLWMPGRSSGRFQRYPHVETNFLDLGDNGPLFAGKLSGIDFSADGEGLQQNEMTNDAVTAEVAAFVRLCQERSGYLVRNARGGLSPNLTGLHRLCGQRKPRVRPWSRAHTALLVRAVFGGHLHRAEWALSLDHPQAGLVLLWSGAWPRVCLSKFAAAVRAGGTGEWYLELLAVFGSDEYLRRSANTALASSSGGPHSLVVTARGRLVHGVVPDVPDEVQVVGLEGLGPL